MVAYTSVKKILEVAWTQGLFLNGIEGRILYMPLEQSPEFSVFSTISEGLTEYVSISRHVVGTSML